MKKFLLSIALLTLFSTLPLSFVVAEEVNTGTGSVAPVGNNAVNQPGSPVRNTPPTKTIPKLSNPIYANSFEEILFAVVDIAIFVGVTFAVFIFIFIGFKFVMAQGDPAALKEARKWFLNAVIGTALLIGSKLIVEVIKSTVTGAGLVKPELFNKK